MNQVNHITANEVLKVVDDYLFIDVRPEYELAKLFDIPNLLFMPYTLLDTEFENLPKDKMLIIADAVGLRSKEVCLRLMNLNFTNVNNLVGGIVEWERKGLPISVDKNRILSGSCMCQLRNRKLK